MTELFETRNTSNRPAHDRPATCSIRNVGRWALVVIRANGIDFEIIPELYTSEAAARQQAQWHQRRWTGVSIKVTRVIVNVEN